MLYGHTVTLSIFTVIWDFSCVFFSMSIILDYMPTMDWHLFKVSSVTFKEANAAILSNSPHWSLITSSYGIIIIDIEINIV